MAVVLSKYREGQYKVTMDGHVKCKRKTLQKARAFADILSGDDDFVDDTCEEGSQKKTRSQKKPEAYNKAK